MKSNFRLAAIFVVSPLPRPAVERRGRPVFETLRAFPRPFDRLFTSTSSSSSSVDHLIRRFVEEKKHQSISIQAIKMIYLYYY